MKFALTHLLRSGSFSILVVLPRHLIRADFSGKSPKLKRLWQSDAPMGESLPVLADAAFALGPARKTSVYVFAASCWTGILSLSSAKASTLSNTELCQALGFEAETLSNISPFDSLLAATPLESKGGDRLYWTTQISRAEMRAVEETLSRRGARLVGVAHPGGLPRSLSERSGKPWSRAELWGDSAVCLSRSEKAGIRFQVFAAFGEQGDWINEVVAWFSEQGFDGAFERLAAPGALFPAHMPPSCDLRDEKTLGDWLTAWAGEITGQALKVPFLRTPPRPLSSGRRVALSVGWAALAAVLCALRWYALRSTEASLQQEITLRQEPGRRLEDAKSRVRSCTLKLEETRRQLQVVQKQRDDWVQVNRWERQRHAVLLHTLADLASNDFVLRSIEESSGETRITVLAMRPELAKFTDRLGAAMAPLNWRVDSPNRQALKLMPDGGPWQLIWTIHESNPTR